jgi:hypothetical protein
MAGSLKIAIDLTALIRINKHGAFDAAVHTIATDAAFSGDLAGRRPNKGRLSR